MTDLSASPWFFIYLCNWSVEHGCSSVLQKILNQGHVFSIDFDQDCSCFINLHQKKDDCSLVMPVFMNQQFLFAVKEVVATLVQWVVVSLRADQNNSSWLLSAEVQNCSIFSAKTCKSVQASMVCNLLVRKFYSGNVTPQMEMKDLSEELWQ